MLVCIADSVLFVSALVCIICIILATIYIFRESLCNCPPADRHNRNARHPHHNGSSHHNGGPDPLDPPPPYSESASRTYEPGTHLINRRPHVPVQVNAQVSRTPPLTRAYDWERGPASRAPAGPIQAPVRQQDRGEGSSNLGATRTSTGYGRSKVR